MSSEIRNIDASAELLEQVLRALSQGRALQIQGGGSKSFYGCPVSAEPISTLGHVGIVDYDPSELVITARAGTRLADLEATLDSAGQMLACEAPHFGSGATVGGTVAAGLSGPRRPWAGSVRDFVLGCRIISGEGKHLRFGGQVMKNVAGYDVSRLMTGSLGCLGLITEVSLKVLPKPRASVTLRLELSREQALERFAAWGQLPLPISALCHDGQNLMLRLEGGEATVKAAREQLGGEVADAGFWPALRDQALEFFRDERPLWRLSVGNDRRLQQLPGSYLIDWGGAQYWLKSEAEAGAIRQLAEAAGGHAACFTPGAAHSPLHPLPAPMLRLHQQLKKSLDPKGIFNPGRMYAGL